jgi:hypothetical protein
MTDGELIGWLLAVHGTVAAVCLAAIWNCFKNSDPFSTTADAGTEALTAMRRRASAALSRVLADLVQRTQSVPTLVLGADGESLDSATYVERLADTASSEAFRECVRDFLEDRGQVWGEYHLLFRTLPRWDAWCTVFQVGALSLFCVELVFLVVLGGMKIGWWS